MNLSEFNAWLVSEAIGNAPTAEQWAAIKERLEMPAFVPPEGISWNGGMGYSRSTAPDLSGYPIRF